jgi:flavin-dependent dehydrogenase
LSAKSDVLVIGGGPAGSSTAIELARRGFRVTLIEKSHFPRHRIGESLPPKTMAALAILGVNEVVQKAGFAQMTGTTVYQAGEMTNHGLSNFDQGLGLQVDRAKFDEILLRRAQEMGCEVLFGRAVNRVEIEENEARLWVDDDEFTARFLVDASGGRSLVAHQLGLRRKDKHRTLALCGYWHACRIPDTTLATNTLFEMLPEAWIWSVLRSDGLRNITVGIDPERFEGAAADLRERYRETLAASDFIGPLAEKSSMQGELRCYESTSYASQSYICKSSILVGDAASFIDPLTSQGVYKALQSGIMAAAVINTIENRPHDEALARKFYQAAQASFVSNYAAITRSMIRSSKYLDQAFWKKRTRLDPESMREIPLTAQTTVADFLSMVRERGGDRVRITSVPAGLSLENVGRAAGGFIQPATILVHENGQSLDLVDIDAAQLYPLLDGCMVAELFETYAQKTGELRSNTLAKQLRDALGKLIERGWLRFEAA